MPAGTAMESRARDQLAVDDGASCFAVPIAAAPARRPRWWLESMLVLWLAWLYDVVNKLAPPRPAAPYAHALSVLHLERRLRLIPGRLNTWLAAHHTRGWWAANYYDIAHYTVTFAMLGCLWWLRPDLYRPLRRGLVMVNLMAPPRLTPGQHFVDVVTTTHAFGSSHSGALAGAANELAADAQVPVHEDVRPPPSPRVRLRKRQMADDNSWPPSATTDRTH